MINSGNVFKDIIESFIPEKYKKRDLLFNCNISYADLYDKFLECPVKNQLFTRFPNYLSNIWPWISGIDKLFQRETLDDASLPLYEFESEKDFFFISDLGNEVQKVRSKRVYLPMLELASVVQIEEELCRKRDLGKLIEKFQECIKWIIEKERKISNNLLGVVEKRSIDEGYFVVRVPTQVNLFHNKDEVLSVSIFEFVGLGLSLREEIKE